MSAPPLLNAVLAAGPDALRCLFTEARPTRAVLLANLGAGWPGAAPDTLNATLDVLLAGGHLLPSATARDRYRLGADVPAVADVWARLSAPALAESREIAGIKSEFSESLKKPESRNKAGIEPEFSESLKKADNRRITDGEPPAPPATIAIEPEWSAPPRFSYYRGGIAATVPHAVMTPAQLFAELTSGRHRARTDALRAAPVGSPQRAELKKGLDYVTPAGTFTRRANNGLQNSSGLLVLDFDRLPDVAAARAALLADRELAPELVLLFTSPSGDGLKALVRTDPTASHLDNFRAYAAYLGRTYPALGLTPDEAGKDVARACFVPHAPDAWLAPAYAPRAA